MKYLWIAASLTLLAMTVPCIAAEEKKAEPIKEEAAKEAPKAEEAEEAKKDDADSEDEKDKEDEEDKEEKPVVKSSTFGPDFCDFEITFPEPPMNSKKCVGEDECYDVQSYTMVYDLSTTVDVTVTCNPSTPTNYNRYSENVMKAAMAGMIVERNLSDHEAQFEQYETTKNASITGTGKTGAQDKIYVGQLWVGQNSIFTVQAELVGDEHEVADKSFRDVLASIKEKPGKQLPKKVKPKNTSKAKNE